MPKTHYRSYQERDAAAVKRLVNEAFRIDRYAPNARLLKSALEVDLRECLLASTYAQVAVQGDEVVGIVMGRLQGQPKVSGVAKNRGRLWMHLLTLAVTGGRHLPTLAQHFTFVGAYARLRKSAGVPTTDELTLFAVDASTRGTGIGTHLYEGYLEHLRSHNRSHYFLYTDSECTFEFYENRGMKRAASENVTLRFNGEPVVLGVYLYAGETAR